MLMVFTLLLLVANWCKAADMPTTLSPQEEFAVTQRYRKTFAKGLEGVSLVPLKPLVGLAVEVESNAWTSWFSSDVARDKYEACRALVMLNPNVRRARKDALFLFRMPGTQQIDIDFVVQEYHDAYFEAVAKHCASKIRGFILYPDTVNTIRNNKELQLLPYEQNMVKVVWSLLLQKEYDEAIIRKALALSRPVADLSEL